MASSSLSTPVTAKCTADLEVCGEPYKESFFILPDGCADVILGHEFLSRHKDFTIHFGGPRKALQCSLAVFDIDPPRPFSNLAPECRPIATRSRKYSSSSSAFIAEETSRLLKEGIIEESTSPWRAQVHVVEQRNQKRRMVIDYSTTINRFTYLDAYPLPDIEEIVNRVSSYRFFSTIDLKSAYHCVPLLPEDRLFTAFEANGKLFQFKRLSFGLTNGVSCFQRIMNDLISRNELQDTFAYLDDVTICGKSQEEHDTNLRRFREMARKYHLTFNDDKCVFSKDSILLLGYLVRHGELRPDPSRLSPLLDMPLPETPKALARLRGLFAYYSKWVPSFSSKVRPLVGAELPLSSEARLAISALKETIVKAVRSTVSEDLPFTVETDASDMAIAATLSQDGRPVAFFSRTLHAAERRHCSIEKEAYAIVEAVRRWRHFLMGRRFTIITDQRSVSFMFAENHDSKIKNEKISRWRLELMPYKYEIVHRSGKLNLAADALSRPSCVAATDVRGQLYILHDFLCHPGVTRMLHFVRSRNLPYSVEEVKRMTRACSICCKIKPRFVVTADSPSIIRALRPFDRLSIDFKGPLPPTPGSSFRYLLIVVDEYSRFPFAFPCKDLSSGSVKGCLLELFSLFGLPSFVHSDRGTSFMSAETRQFLQDNGVAMSRTTPYHPQGNGQCERYVGIVWRAVQLALESRGLPTTHWTTVLQEALHSIRSLLCTSTNSTPHERLFSFSRRSYSSSAIPTWLLNPGKVLLRRYVRGKSDPYVTEVELLEASPNYAHVRFPNGREDTVALRDVAPAGILHPDPTRDLSLESPFPVTSPAPSPPVSSPPALGRDLTPPTAAEEPSPSAPLRRSSRERRPPDRLVFTSLGGGD